MYDMVPGLENVPQTEVLQVSKMSAMCLKTLEGRDVKLINCLMLLLRSWCSECVQSLMQLIQSIALFGKLINSLSDTTL